MAEKPEHPDKPEKPEHPDKPEKPEHPDKPEKPEHPDKPEKPDTPPRAQANASPDEGYGESSGSLGQFTDEYTDLDNVSVNIDVERNSTYNAMELNHSGLGVSWGLVEYTEDFEDFPTGWTVANGGGGTIVKSDLQKYGGSYSVKIYAPATASYCYGFDTFNNALNDDSLCVFYLWVDPSVVPVFEHVVGLYDTVAGSYVWEIRLEYHDSGYWIQNDVSGSGTDVSEIDASEWVELILYFNDTSNKVRYVIDGRDKGEFNANNGAGNGNRVYIGDTWGAGWRGFYYIDDLTFGTGSFVDVYFSEGYFITEDYLDYVNGSALVHLTNTTIPDDTEITVEFSEDNSSWVLNDWAPIFGGFESIDLRDLDYSAGYFVRYNFSTINTTITPRLYQSRLITTVGEIDILVESDFPWIAIAIILSCVSYLLLSSRK